MDGGSTLDHYTDHAVHTMLAVPINSWHYFDMSVFHNWIFHMCVLGIKYTYIPHPFNGPFSGTTQVSRYQKSKTNLDFTEARDSDSDSDIYIYTVSQKKTKHQTLAHNHKC